MDTISIAPPPGGDTRELRALRLVQARGHEIVRTAPWTYNVPSCTGEGFYVVDYRRETCDCPNATRRPDLNCKHLLARAIKRAKHRTKRRSTGS